MGRHTAHIRRIAREVFHYKSLRPGQEEAITSVLEGHDTLAVMPTGSGKSAIYQIPALLMDGPTVVVSPLIALQKDQADSLLHQHAGGASVLNSLGTAREQEAALAEAEDGETEFLFLAPEQLSNPERLQAIKAAAPSLFVVDEAHCISEWGHSFRPAYLRLKEVIEELGHPVVLALTATANEDVRSEIALRLGMREPRVFVHGVDRPNIWLGVEVVASEEKKRVMLLDRIRSSRRPGIVYTSTRKHAEEIADELSNIDIPAASYHAGLKRAEREAAQQRFMDGDLEVMVATSAFGMGVDKSNVRFVYHFSPPDSLDAWYQEAGRAGRDGEPASTVLFYSPGDLTIHKFFKGAGQIGAADVQLVLDVLDAETELEQEELRARSRLSKTKLARVLNRLEEQGVVEFQTNGSVRTTSDTNFHAADTAAEAQQRRHQAELERIEQMRRYAESLSCRRAFVLSWFGEESPAQCGNCDNCQGTGTARAELIAATRCDSL